MQVDQASLAFYVLFSRVPRLLSARHLRQPGGESAVLHPVAQPPHHSAGRHPSAPPVPQQMVTTTLHQAGSTATDRSILSVQYGPFVSMLRGHQRVRL